MKNNALLKFALIASLILNLTVLATVGYVYYERSGYWVSPFGTTMKRDRFLFEELSLRPEQMKSMKARAMLFRAEIDRRREAIVIKRKELIALMRADKPDQKAIEVVIEGISGMQSDMQHGIVDHMLEEKALLEPEQQKKFLDLIERKMVTGGSAGCPPVEQSQ